MQISQQRFGISKRNKTHLLSHHNSINSI